MDNWSEDALQQQQCSPGPLLDRGGEQQQQQEEEESSYEHGLMLVDSGNDPRAWLALVQPADACAAHATASDYLQHSPGSSTGSYQGKSSFPHQHVYASLHCATGATGSWGCMEEMIRHLSTFEAI